MSCDEEKKIESVQEDNISRSREESLQNICEQSLKFNSNDSDKEFIEDIEADEIDKSPKMFIENEKIVIREGDSSSMMSEKIDGHNCDILKKDIEEIDFKNDINTPQEIIVDNFVSDSMSNNDQMAEDKYIHKEVFDIDKIYNLDESLKIIGDDAVSESMKRGNILVTKYKSFSELDDSGRINISNCEDTIKLYQENVIGESLKLIDNNSPSETMEKGNILNDEEKFISGIEDSENYISECDGHTKIYEANDISECQENIGNSMSDSMEKDDVLNNEEKCFSVEKLDGINNANESQKMIVDNIQATMDESFLEELDYEGDNISDCEDITQALENTLDNMSKSESEETSQMKKISNDIDLLIQDSKIDDNVLSVPTTASQGSLLLESIGSGEVDMKKDKENSVQQKMKWRSAKVLMLRSSYMKGYKYDEEELGLPAITYIDSIPNDIVPIFNLLESYFEKNKEISLENFDFLIVSPFDAMINEFLSPSAVCVGEIGVVGKRISSGDLLRKQKDIFSDMKQNSSRLREKYPNLKIICMLPHPIKYSKIDSEICVNDIEKFKNCISVNQYCWLSTLNRDCIKIKIPFISLMSFVVRSKGNWKLIWKEKINSDRVGLGFSKKLEAKMWNVIKLLWEMDEEHIQTINLNRYNKSNMRRPEGTEDPRRRRLFMDMKMAELKKVGFRSFISRLTPIYYFHLHKAIARHAKNPQILTEKEKQSDAVEGALADCKTTKSKLNDQDLKQNIKNTSVKPARRLGTEGRGKIIKFQSEGRAKEVREAVCTKKKKKKKAVCTEEISSSKRKRTKLSTWCEASYLKEREKNTSARQPVSSWMGYEKGNTIQHKGREEFPDRDQGIGDVPVQSYHEDFNEFVNPNPNQRPRHPLNKPNFPKRKRQEESRCNSYGSSHELPNRYSYESHDHNANDFAGPSHGSTSNFGDLIVNSVPYWKNVYRKDFINQGLTQKPENFYDYNQDPNSIKANSSPYRNCSRKSGHVYGTQKPGTFYDYDQDQKANFSPYSKCSRESGHVSGQSQNSNQSNIHNSTQSQIPHATFDGNLSAFKHEPGLYQHDFAVNPPVGNFPGSPPIGNFPGPEPAGKFSDPQSIGNFPGLQPVGNFTGPQPVGNFPGPQPAGNFSDPQSIGNFSGPQSIDNFPGPQPEGNFAHSSQDLTRNRLNTAPQNQTSLQSHSDVNSSNPGILPRTNQSKFNSNKQSRRNFQTANQRTNRLDGYSVAHFSSSQGSSGNYQPRNTEVEYSPLHALNMLCEAKEHLGYLGNDVMNVRDDTSKLESRKENSMKLFQEIDRNSLVQMCFCRLKKASSSSLDGFDQLLVNAALQACKRLVEEINKLY